MVNAFSPYPYPCIRTCQSVDRRYSGQQKNCCVAIVRSPRRKSFRPMALNGLASMRNELSGQSALDSLLAPAVEAAGYRLVRLRIKGAARKTLQVMAERPDGQMDVDDCAALSRALSEVLEAADPISDEYVLEVSSPGIDRPLTAESDFARFAGHEARVELTQPIDGRKRFKGVLMGLDDHEVLMEVSDEGGMRPVRLPTSDIADAKLVLTDHLIRESLKARALKEAKASH